MSSTEVITKNGVFIKMIIARDGKTTQYGEAFCTDHVTDTNETVFKMLYNDFSELIKEEIKHCDQ